MLAQLITARGYGRIQADDQLAAAWAAAAGEPLASYSRPGQLRRGTLEVTVTNSTIMQELTFQKQRILAELGRNSPTPKSATSASASARFNNNIQHRGHRGHRESQSNQ